MTESNPGGKLGTRNRDRTVINEWDDGPAEEDLGRGVRNFQVQVENNALNKKRKFF